jgi:hypothetical protein
MTTSAPLQREPFLKTAAERAADGRALRDRLPRSRHSAWSVPPDRPDPVIAVVERSRDLPARLAALQNARLAQSAFAFFRATPDVMAADLARTPSSGLRVQLCGDAHCLNFGPAVTPERSMSFELLDFAQTAPGPWEWDLKRLAASLVLAADATKTKKENAHAAIMAAARSYRLRMHEFAPKTALETWYALVDASPPAVAVAESDPEARRRRRQIADGARLRSARAALEQLTVVTADGRRLRRTDAVPAPPNPFGANAQVEGALVSYAENLTPDVRVLYGKYRFVDAAPAPLQSGRLGAGGSVALLQAGIDDPLVLELRSAEPSVLEQFAGPSGAPNPAERIVTGRRLMQRADDPLLGWAAVDGRAFVVNQFRTEKGALEVGAFDGFGLRDYAGMCGSALAGAHARSGDAAQIAGYLGKGDTFDKALVRFGLLYAAQAEHDHVSVLAAIDRGSLPVA